MARYLQSYRRARQLTLSILLFSATLVSACNTVDPLDQRAETVNRNTNDYANNATLLNVVRASLWEPLSFITITGVSGLASASANAGFGGFTLGEHVHTSPHTFLLGPDTVSKSNTTTVTMGAVVDPASNAALLAPLNPAILAAFARVGYSRELLFFLFTERIREVKPAVDHNGNVVKDKSGSVEWTFVDEWVNNPDNIVQPQADHILKCLPDDRSKRCSFGRFLGKMGTLLAKGLTANIDATTTPTGRSLPQTMLCFDPNLQLPDFVDAAGNPETYALVRKDQGDTCQGGDWIQAQGGDNSGKSTGGSGGTGAGPANLMTVANDNSLWVSLAGQNAVIRITASPDGTLKKSNPIPLPPPPASAEKHAPMIAYIVEDAPTNEKEGRATRYYQLYFRSTYGVYQYIGALLRNHADVSILAPDGSQYRGLINVIPPRPRSTNDCFAEISYRDIQYCAPANADGTKRLFTLLLQLQQLSTAPATTPTTLTSVTVP